MIVFELSPEVRKCISGSNLQPDEKTVLLAQTSISHENLYTLYTRVKPTATFLQFVKQTKLVVPSRNITEVKPKTKEFEESMARLKLLEMESEYQRLVKPKPTFGALYEDRIDEEPYNPAQAHKEVKSHITTMFNILISVASVVYAIWYWTNTSWRLRDSYRVLLCLFFGILILVAEVVVYIGYLNKIEAARVKERQKKEVKRVVRSYQLN